MDEGSDFARAFATFFVDGLDDADFDLGEELADDCPRFGEDGLPLGFGEISFELEDLGNSDFVVDEHA
ncbi:MAG: hypothetical protein DI616_15660 [Paracoccus denitrificans]|uniref:Uncharacterized protein n=1 Tax=Paracoccus denitrificans TaxID=266 RepID=A0A533I5S8_PARDE|nr:MAG: hypothetical protein DI616_15660 [Paracoccus denitrificans]